MKRVLVIACTLLFSSYCFAGLDSNSIHSAVQNAFAENSINSKNNSPLQYSGKDISRSTFASDERSSTIQLKIIG